MNRVSYLLALIAAMAIGTPYRASAQLSLNPYLDAHIERDSNVYRAPSSQALLAAIGDTTLADTDERYAVGLEGAYLWSQQKLTATIEGRKYNYKHYTDLDHNEYLADVALNWKLTSLLDGLLEGRQERVMAPFALGNSTRLTINVDRNIAGKLNLNFTPDWRLETGLYFHTLNSPLQNFPDFVERDVGKHLALDYNGIGNLTYGLALDRIDGKFENAANVGPYIQNTAQLTLRYAVGASSIFNAAAGYSKRDQNANAGTVSAMTGSIGYTRQLTGKTSVNLGVTRAVNSYLAAGGSEIDTSATAGLNWQATYKILVALNYTYTHSQFAGQVIPGSLANGRVDRSPAESLNITYQALRRLQFHAFFNNQSRTSNVELANFSDSLVGIEAKLTWK